MILNATQLFGFWYMEDFMGLVGLKNNYLSKPDICSVLLVRHESVTVILVMTTREQIGVNGPVLMRKTTRYASLV